VSERLRRFFVPDLAGTCGPGRRVALPDEEAHHAVDVLRLAPGAAVELFDGRGLRAAGQIAESSRARTIVQIDRIATRQERHEPIMHLAFAAPKAKRLDWLLEKATELGCASLQPVRFRRSVAGAGPLTPAKRRRWLGRCVAAAKQARLDFLPETGDPMVLNDFLKECADGLRLLGDTDADAMPLPKVLAGGGRPAITVLVGPEGGLTEAERTAAIAAGFVPVRAGATTLRTETAAVSLLAVALALCRHVG